MTIGLPPQDSRPTERFSDRVDEYVRYRPYYPIEVVRTLEREAGIRSGKTRIVDLGCGTGISAELFLREGYSVVGVEPNSPMRAAAEARLFRCTPTKGMSALSMTPGSTSAAFQNEIAMDFETFRKSLARSTPPEELSAELEALWSDARGDWDGAHRLVQDLETPESAWVHAYLHRKEGDISNAGYWYRRAGRPPKDVALGIEWEEIARALTA